MVPWTERIAGKKDGEPGDGEATEGRTMMNLCVCVVQPGELKAVDGESCEDDHARAGWRDWSGAVT